MSSQIYFNGTVLTMDEHNTTTSAVGVTDGAIISVGDLVAVEQAMPADATRIDLKGRTMTPGFIDPHGHFPDPGFITLFRVNVSSPPVGTCLNLKQVFDRIRPKVAQTPKGEWVMAVSLDQTALEDQRFPTRDELDALSTDHPIWVIHASGHAGVANSMALQMQGITEDTPDPLGGCYQRDANGRLNGLIEGLSAMKDMSDTDFLINDERFTAGFQETAREYYSHGVTMAQNSWATDKLLKLFATLAETKDPGFDVLVLPAGELEPELTNNELGYQFPDNDRIWIGPRKLLSDGAFQMQTAKLTEPYYRPANGDPEHSGRLYLSVDEINTRIRQLHDMGYQVHIHCNGDGSSDVVLDAFEDALKATPRADHRHTIIHGQLLRDDQLKRIADLGLTVSFFVAHVYYWGDAHRDRFLGPDRAKHISPLNSAMKHGIRFTIHNDAAVTPTRPLHLISCAVNRLTNSGKVLGEEERISAPDALRAHTIDCAWQVFQEDKRGSIEPGKRADFAILSDNPLDIPDRIHDITVLETIVKGQTTYEATS